MSSSNYSASVLPIMYEGDGVQRGLAGLPTIITPTDLVQGAGVTDPRIARTIRDFSTTFNSFTGGQTFGSNNGQQPGAITTDIPGQTPPIAISGGGNPIQDAIDQFKKGREIGQSVFGGGSSSGFDCADLSMSSAVAHPIDTANCLLNRFLFGILALVLIGGGIYLFGKD